MRAVTVVLVLGLASSLARRASADDKKVCADAYVEAQSLRTDRKLLAARSQLRICAANECKRVMGGRLIRDCTAWLVEIEASIPTVVLAATDPAGKELQDVKVSVDGAAVAAALDGHAVEMEPGSHVFTFVDPQGVTATQTQIILEGTKNQAVRVTLGAPPPSVPSTTPPAGSAAPAGGGGSAPPPAPSKGTTQRVIALVAGGAGVAALAAGGVFGLLASSSKTDYGSHCGAAIGAPPGGCDPTGIREHSDASTRAGISTGLFIGGGVALAAGAVLFFTAPRGAPAAAEVGFGPGAILVRGSF
jgi:hypothetical protein